MKLFPHCSFNNFRWKLIFIFGRNAPLAPKGSLFKCKYLLQKSRSSYKKSSGRKKIITFPVITCCDLSYDLPSHSAVTFLSNVHFKCKGTFNIMSLLGPLDQPDASVIDFVINTKNTNFGLNTILLIY